MSESFDQAIRAVIDGDASTLKQMLQDDPELVRARSSKSHQATLLHYLGANGIERTMQRTPPNALEICRLLLDAGANPDATSSIYSEGTVTLTLVLTSSHPFKAGVQLDLVRALINGGANPNGPEGDGANTRCNQLWLPGHNRSTR